MGYLVKMPQMGLEMEQGELVTWEVEVGEVVEAGDVIALVESEKATNEIEAREKGVVRRTLLSAGETAEPGEPIGIFASPEEDISAFEDEVGVASASTTQSTESPGADSPSSPDAAQDHGHDADAVAQTVRATPGAKRRAEEADVDLTSIDGTGPQGTITEDDVAGHARTASDDSTPETEPASSDREGGPSVRATPEARQLADQEGIDLTTVDGTGPQGTVTEADVEDAVKELAQADEGATRTVTEARELSRMQQNIGARMQESYREAPHVTLNRTFDASALETVVAAAERDGIDVSVTDLLVRAVGVALGAHPAFNALFEDGTHTLIDEVNIGVAVDIDGGLVTPVVPSVTDKSVEAVASVRGRLTQRALDAEFTGDDLQGGTFTITNLGPLGVDSFDPIINPPEVAILGVGRIRDDGSLTLSLSFDHRVVNGADGARFLGSIVERASDTAALAQLFEADLFDAVVAELTANE